MSLFPSAFDIASAGPSSTVFTALPTAKPNKRKRPSLAKGERDHQLRATQANLEKLMNKVEKGAVREKGHGSDAMGLPSQTKTKKKKKTDGHPNETRDPIKKEKSREPRVTHQRPNPKDKNKSASAKAPLPPQNIRAADPDLAEGGEEGLTDMQKGMKVKLEGARFRWINEQLYSTPSTEAVAMMKKDPQIFADYHMTHRALTSAWPSPPLPYLISLLSPLPPKTLIVDLGCGDAGLAKALVPQGKLVLSYDLVGDGGVPGSRSIGEGWVVEADFLEGVPLPGRPGGLAAVGGEGSQGKKRKKGGQVGDAEGSEVVDVVVCCLSLMGINWVGGVYEACRILKQGGPFHVAEVTSRFVSIEAFVEMVESFGFELEKQESPSTHFTLFCFVKTAAVPVGPARGQKGWRERVAEGEGILRGCVYKKR